MSERAKGYTYLELLATAGILLILASAIMPLARVTRTRQKEIELRRALRTLRTAIDDFKKDVDAGRIGGTYVRLGAEGYPEELELLVEGVNPVGKTTKKKFLRRIPIDPMTGKAEWGMRCYQDKPDSTSWCRENVYDVYSLATAKALDGSKYQDW
ncbi:MAG TPA: type II secretion system protein [Vicinamibacteria bacterium]|nr:type II secretion system protein [Vicinamibacteria bacterium]